MSHPVQAIYDALLADYGPQGWWPLLELHGTPPSRDGHRQGYHPADYSFPRTPRQRFEIAVGAVLTQNTAWSNVELALARLEALKAFAPERILALADAELEAAIRPSGYFRGKRRKLKGLAEFWLGLRGRTPSRTQLLSVWGIGPETADSIRLYAFGEPELVVDAYTRRLLEARGLVRSEASYDDLRACCSLGLRREVPVYQEFHALIVEHGKRRRGPGRGRREPRNPGAEEARPPRRDPQPP